MRRFWIIWLMIALLPLRGWAWTAMALDGVDAAGAPAASAPAAGSDRAAAHAACHEHADSKASTPTGDAHDCKHCATCHGALAPMSLVAALPDFTAPGPQAGLMHRELPQPAAIPPFKPPRR